MSAGTNPKTTPAMEQYFRIKEAHPDCLLFFRMGDFYEMFFEDAKVAAAALNITLTRRGKQEGEDIPMCGVPFHAADAYLARLIKQGFRVAICDQLESPAEAKKRGYKSVVKRDVVRIVTPGTLTEDNLLSPQDHNFLVALAVVNGQIALAWIDLSTGSFTTAKSNASHLEEQLSRLSPKEILVPDTAMASLGLSPNWQDLWVPQPLARFDSKSADKRLCAAFGLASLESLGNFSRAELGAAGAILSYLELTQKSEIHDLGRLTQERNQTLMGIDAATRRNLELIQGPENSRKGSLLATVDRSVSALGARELLSRLSGPLAEKAPLDDRLDQVQTLVEAEHFRQDLRALLKQVPDLDRAVQRLVLDRAGPRDLLTVKECLSLANRFRRLSSDLSQGSLGLGDEAPCLKPLFDALTHDGEALEQLTLALQPEVPMLARDGNWVRPQFAVDLDEFRTLRDEGRRLIANLQAAYEKETRVQGLKIKHNKVLGYFIEVKAQHADRIPASPGDKFIHRQSMANMVRFTTTELAELEGRIRQAGDRALEREIQIYEQLRQSVLATRETLIRMAKAFADLDVTAALAELAVELDWTRPVIKTGTDFHIEAGRHPVVEAALAREAKAFMANDCTLSPTSDLWLLTGPNMAGKSTFLRQNALITILAQIGSFVPAKRAEIGLVDRLFSRVGAADDLARGRSTFMVEMVETATILSQASQNSLVILDEIGRGTATFDGLSIAWATVEQLHEVNQCRTLFATHYHELTALEPILARLSSHSMKVKEWQGDILFLHEVEPGAANRSYGIHVAKLAGLPAPVIERAKAILAHLEQGDKSHGVSSSQDGPEIKQNLAALPLFENMSTAPARPVEVVKTSEVEVALRDLQPDLMTPREALDHLYRLRDLLGKT